MCVCLCLCHVRVPQHVTDNVVKHCFGAAHLIQLQFLNADVNDEHKYFCRGTNDFFFVCDHFGTNKNAGLFARRVKSREFE